MCHIAAVAIPRRIVTEIENKAAYIAEGLTRNLVSSIGKNNEDYSTEDLLSDLVAEHCKAKGGCLDQRSIKKELTVYFF